MLSEKCLFGACCESSLENHKELSSMVVSDRSFSLLSQSIPNFVFSVYCQLIYFFYNYVIITRVVLKLASYQSCLSVLSEITVFGITSK